MYLLDANVLIALGDADHVHHVSVLAFFMSEAIRHGWATCPLTQNAFLRVLSHPSYPGGSNSPELVRQSLFSIIQAPGHQFWPDDITFLDRSTFPVLPASREQTDTYLLALALRHRGRLATCDRRLDPTLISGGPSGYFVIPSE